MINEHPQDVGLGKLISRGSPMMVDMAVKRSYPEMNLLTCFGEQQLYLLERGCVEASY